jgi:hypothetical protein
MAHEEGAMQEEESNTTLLALVIVEIEKICIQSNNMWPFVIMNRCCSHI